MLIVDNISKSYALPTGSLAILRNVSFRLESGESLAVMGPSGSGKSTLLNILGALDSPTSGTLTLDMINPFNLGNAELSGYRNTKIGFIFQEHHLLPQCSVLENVLVPTLPGGSSNAGTREARELLDAVGLSDRIDHRPSELSGGERQRVAIARALINRPMLVLADEPTGNLDSETAAQVIDLLLALHRESSRMLVLVTHGESIGTRLDDIARLDDGRLARDSG